MKFLNVLTPSDVPAERKGGKLQNLGSVSNDITGWSLKPEKVHLSSWESHVPSVVWGCVYFRNSNNFRKVNLPPAKTPTFSWNRNPLSWGFRSRSYRGGSCWSSWKPHVYIREKNLARPFPLYAVQDEIPSFQKLVSKKCWQVSVCVFNTVPSPVPCEWGFSSGLGRAFLSLSVSFAKSESATLLLCNQPWQRLPRKSLVWFSLKYKPIFCNNPLSDGPGYIRNSHLQIRWIR